MSLLRADTLELKVPPVVLVLVAGFLMWLVSRTLPPFALPSPARGIVALALAGVGAAVGFAGVAGFRRAKTTVNPTSPGAASSLVTTGVHAFTRNPMYLGLVLILVGWGSILGNALSVVIVALFVLYMNRFQIHPEEKALLAGFGESFLAYKKRVRRWL